MSFEIDSVLKTIIDELKTKYHCHTIILYGSRARGDHTSTSDYDVAGISSTKEQKRIARFDEEYHVYHDLFIYPEDNFASLTEEHLKMADGIVVVDKDDFGKNLLLKLQQMMDKPEPIAPDEIQVRKV